MKNQKNEYIRSGKPTMKTPRQYWICRMLLGTLLALTNLAYAGVIQGTGPGSLISIPNAAQLGATDAVGFQMAESGTGHMLVVPYFTAQNGQMSVLHLVNTDTVNGKAVKLRYRGAGNGDTLLDFTILLSPTDVWTGAVQVGNDGRAHIITADTSCTYPRIQPNQLQAFSTARLNPQWSFAELANNTREGYVEAIVMADIPSHFRYGTGANSRSALYTAIHPVAGVPPCTPSTLDAAMLTDTNVEAIAASRGFATPTGTLMGSWYIIDVPNTTTFYGAATAFTAVNSSGQSARGNYVLFPQSSETVAQPERFTTDPLLVSAGLAGRSMTPSGTLGSLTQAAVAQARFSDLPDLSTPYYLPASFQNARRTAGDISQILAAKSVRTQYALDPSISAKTDLVLSMPTKRYSVAYDYSANASGALRTVYSPIFSSSSARPYFHDSSQNIDVSRGQLLTSLMHYATTTYDRSGAANGTSLVFIATKPSLKLPGTVAAVSLDSTGTASALGSSLTNQKLEEVGLFANGWLYMNLWGVNDLGLPVLGSSFIKLSNPAAQPGVSGNYGIAWPHSYTR
jgi:hypothetical protein